MRLATHALTGSLLLSAPVAAGEAGRPNWRPIDRNDSPASNRSQISTFSVRTTDASHTS